MHNDTAERILISAYKSGGPGALKARAELLAGYMGYIRATVIKMGIFPKKKQFDLEDAVQDGAEGFLHAIDTFDLARKDSTFLTYATTAIRNNVLRHYAVMSDLVSGKAGVRGHAYTAKKALRALGNEEPTIHEISEYIKKKCKFGYKEITLREVMDRDTLDLDMQVDAGDGNMATFHEMIPSGENLEDDVIKKMTEKPIFYEQAGNIDGVGGSVGDAIKTLTPKQKVAIDMHYWGGKGLRKIAAETGQTTSMVDSALRAGERKLKRQLFHLFRLNGIRDPKDLLHR